MPVLLGKEEGLSLFLSTEALDAHLQEVLDMIAGIQSAFSQPRTSSNAGKLTCFDEHLAKALQEQTMKHSSWELC